MKKLSSSILLIAVFALVAFADVRMPDNTPTPTKQRQAKAINTELHISIDRNAKEARLRIPKSQVKQLRAELDQMEDSDATAASVSFSKTQTVVSGLFLSLAFVFGGVWFVRSRNKGETKANKTLVAGAGLFLTGAMATIAFANIGPPPEVRSITGKIFTESVHRYKQASGRINLEISDEIDEIELIVPEAKSDDRKGEE